MNPHKPFPNGRPSSPDAGPASPTATAAAPDDKGQRDSKGRFTANNKGGPGNPFARRTAALRQAMLAAVTEDDLQEIVRQLIQKAKDGDVSAARLVLSYTVGKPDRAVDPDTLDHQEWQQLVQGRVLPDDWDAVIGGMQVPQACLVLRTVLPFLQDKALQDFCQQAAQPVPEQETPGQRPGQRSPCPAEGPGPDPARSPAEAGKAETGTGGPVPAGVPAARGRFLRCTGPSGRWGTVACFPSGVPPPDSGLAAANAAG